MSNFKIKGKIPVVFLKEGDMFVAHCPVLDLSSCGENFEEASKNFDEALEIFFAECVEHGTLEKALTACGWNIKPNKKGRKISPPVYLGERQVRVPELCPA